MAAQLLAKGTTREEASSEGFLRRLTLPLSRPVNGASLGVFRIALGFVMAMEAYCLTVSNAQVVASGETPLSNYYTGPDITFHFPFAGLEWLPLLPPAWIYALVALLAVAGVAMAAGLCYRLSSAAVFLTWTYLWCVESTRTYWQSHFYLEVLLTFLMIWMPAAWRFSVDAWIARRRAVRGNSQSVDSQPPQKRLLSGPGRTPMQDRPTDQQRLPGWIPFWPIFLVRGQLVIAYFYAGVCKLNQDWILDAVPVRWFLADPEITEPYKEFLSKSQLAMIEGVLRSTELAYFISYAGALFDLCIGFLLLVRRTRIFGMVLMIIFHALNHFVIFDDIGMFPVMGVATATIFFDPDWPERLWRWLKSPRIAKPDWGWLIGGALLAPVVGAALGWKLAPTGRGREVATPPRWRLAPLAFVVAWLTWQALLPTRHYFIPGDGRFTYEGMSFSWRLKSDVRQALPHELYVSDRTIVSREPATGRTVINWDAWHGDKVIYRVTQPARVNWLILPEIVALLEPVTGERIVYNPYSRYVGPPRSEDESHARVKRNWHELYDREADVRPTIKLAEALERIVLSLRAANVRGPAVEELAQLVARAEQLDPLQPDGAALAELTLDVRGLLEDRLAKERPVRDLIRPILRRMDPFALYGHPPLPHPFLAIEDPLLFDASAKDFDRIDRAAWGNRRYETTEPLVIYVGPIDASNWDMLPQAFIRDFLDFPERSPLIRWNSAQDLTLSKYMHTSVQPFYLRRYARRVAGLWEAEYGRRPAIHAMTSMSFNGRPRQLLVDPSADLATVPVRWFGHNEWVMDLKTPRIPPEGLTKNRLKQ